MHGTQFRVQPIVSTDAINSIHDLHTLPVSQPTPVTTLQLASRAHSRTRFQQVLLTAFPLLLADVAAMGACFAVATLMASLLSGLAIPLNQPRQLVAVSLTYFGLATVIGLYPATAMNPVVELQRQLIAILLACLVLFTENAMLGELSRMELLSVMLMLPIASMAMPAARFSMRRLCPRFSWWGEKAIVVGAGPQGRAVYHFFSKSPQRGLRPIGVVDDEPQRYWQGDEFDANMPYLGRTNELVSMCEHRKVHWVVAAVADRTPAEIAAVLHRGSMVANLVILSNPILLPSLWVESFEAAGLNGVHIRDRLLFPTQRIIKRLFDVCLATFLLLMALPVVLVSAVLIKIKSPGPVFYSNPRIGRGGRRFGAWKIRTMVTNAQQRLDEYLEQHPEARREWEEEIKLKFDPRVIPGIGRFLRKTSLDELPQIWNVLRGDMSLVGPRPILLDELEKYEAYSEAWPLYQRVRPGLTGLWQISGRNNTSYGDRVRLNTYYIRNWSTWLDYYILLRTIRTVIFREGSY